MASEWGSGLIHFPHVGSSLNQGPCLRSSLIKRTLEGTVI